MIKAILFDVDGVLLDSFESNLDFFQKVMPAAGYPTPTAEQYRPLFYVSMRDTIIALSGQKDEAEIERIKTIALSPEIVSLKPKLMDGAEEAIKQLAKKYILAVVTGRIREYALEGEAIKLKDFFKTIVAYEDTKEHKPAPEPLLKAAANLGLEPQECLYVGDALIDYQAAQAAGMSIVMFRPAEKIEGAKMINDFSELEGLL